MIYFVVIIVSAATATSGVAGKDKSENEPEYDAINGALHGNGVLFSISAPFTPQQQQQ